MRNAFMAVVERCDGRYTARCPEIPEAIGQGGSTMGSLFALQSSVQRILIERLEFSVRQATSEAVFETIHVEVPLRRAVS